ncbi:MAG: putative membrane protein [Polaribacter sp.]|jgi:putative membrane protein
MGKSKSPFKIKNMDSILVIVTSAIAFYLGAQVLSGVSINNFWQALLVALAIAVLNVTLGIVLKIVTLGVLSLGIFTLFLDAILIQVADYFVAGIKVKNFWWALALATVVSIIDGVIGWLV